MSDGGDAGAAVIDCVIVGGGPAGLSAALNLARARRRVVLVDANRPRNAATLVSHGFITRDGIPPHELRRLAREELAAYPLVEVRQRQRATRITRDGEVLVVEVAGGAESESPIRARTVVLAHGLAETLPSLPSIRAYYGMSLFSCVACDGLELGDRPLALIGETEDLAARAILISQWSDTLTVFTNGSAAVTEEEAEALRARDIAVERRPIADLEGERGTLTGVRLADGALVAVTGGFVRPEWHVDLALVAGLGRGDVPGPDGEPGPGLTEGGLIATDPDGRTASPGLYAAGDAVSGPQQLIVAAGAGARVASVINHDLLDHELITTVGAH